VWPVSEPAGGDMDWVWLPHHSTNWHIGGSSRQRREKTRRVYRKKTNEIIHQKKKDAQT